MNFRTCPKGYRQIAVLDFVRSRKQMQAVAVLGLGAVVVMVALALAFVPFGPTWALLKAKWWAWFVAPAMYLLYIPLHELVHGLLMHALSGVRPKYGMKLPYAYAGSPVYFDRRSHNIIAIAPLVLWGIALFALERALPAEWFWLIYVTQISNVSGSMGDVYCVWYLSRLPRGVLVQDTGTRMRILAPRPEKNEEPK